MKRVVMTHLQEEHGVSIRRACKALGFSRSSHYESKRGAKRREEAEAPVVESIKKVQEHRYKRFYGSPRMADELIEQGHGDMTRHKTARIMNKYGIYAKKHKRFVRTIDSKHKEPLAKNILDRDFNAGSGSKAWCADISVPQQAAQEMRVWSLAIGLQGQIAIHRKRLWSKALVVSVAEKAL